MEYVEFGQRPRGISHLVGKASDMTGVEVAPEILARYAGVYAGTRPSGRPIRFEIFPSGGELWFSRDGGAKQPATPLSDTRFVVPAGAELEFLEAGGEVVAIQFYGVGVDARLPRVGERK
jgi:hypothetical protein